MREGGQLGNDVARVAQLDAEASHAGIDFDMHLDAAIEPGAGALDLPRGLQVGHGKADAGCGGVFDFLGEDA